WNLIAGRATGSSATNYLWLYCGVITAAGSQTITISITAGGTNQMSAQEFTSGGGSGTTGAQDGAGAPISNAASPTVTFPTLTPAASTRLYVGYGTAANAITAASQTSGYSMQTGAASTPYAAMLWNGNVSTSQSPTCTQGSAGTSGCIAA